MQQQQPGDDAQTSGKRKRNAAPARSGRVRTSTTLDSGVDADAPPPTPARGRGRSPAQSQVPAVAPAAAAPAPPSRKPSRVQGERKRQFGKRERGLEGNYGPPEVMEASIAETLSVFSHPNLQAVRRCDPLSESAMGVCR